MQTLQRELKNVPTDASLVCSSTSCELNRDESLSAHSKVLICNNPEVNQPQQGGDSNLRVSNVVFVLSMSGKPLMPCKSQKAKKLLKGGKANVVKSMAIDNNGIFGTSAYSINNEYRLCLILAEEESGNILAGFENLRSVAGEYKSFILMEGESYNGMTLVDVDLENSLAQVLYEDKIVPFKLVRKNAASATAQLSIGTTFQPNMDFQNPSSPQTIPNISFEF